MLKDKLLKLQDKIFDKLSTEIYARVVRPELERRSVEQKARMDEAMAEALKVNDAKNFLDGLNREFEKDHPAPFPATRQGAYVLGEVDRISLTKSYTTFAGVDVRVWITDEPWEMGTREKAYGNCQGISWTIDRESGRADGTIIDLCLDEATCPEGKWITVAAFNEYGKSCVLFEGTDFKVVTTSSGVCIDDMVVEQQHTFTCMYVGAYPLPVFEKFETPPVKPTFEDWN